MEAFNEYYCFVCENKVKSFLPFGIKIRPNAMCPICKSLERHRLVWLYFKEKTNLFKDKLNMLHIAPEKQISNLLKKVPNIKYLSADIVKGKAMVKMDITKIKYPDNTFDVIYASHVLEHIPDDIKAMRELCRVLKPAGWAILQVPIWGKKTLEGHNIKTSAERKRVLSQDDHVRRYGKDGIYKKRLEKSGFIVAVDPYVRTLDKEDIARYVLVPKEYIYFCRKSGSN